MAKQQKNKRSYRFREFFTQMARALRKKEHTTQTGDDFRVRDLRIVMETMVDEVLIYLAKHPTRRVCFRGLGYFYVKEKAPTERVNPFTKKKYKLGRRWYLRFKTYDSFNRNLSALRDKHRKKLRKVEGNAFTEELDAID